MKNYYIFLLTLLISLTSFNNPEKEKFIGSSALKPCIAKIPLDYSTKGQNALKTATEKYKNIELTLVTIEKKGIINYEFFYIEGYQGTYGPSSYLVRSKDRDSKNSPKLFLKFKPKKHIFYTAECFRKTLESNSNLNKTLTEVK